MKNLSHLHLLTSTVQLSVITLLFTCSSVFAGNVSKTFGNSATKSQITKHYNDVSSRTHQAEYSKLSHNHTPPVRYLSNQPGTQVRMPTSAIPLNKPFTTVGKFK